mgnify:CR=1 FL=1
MRNRSNEQLTGFTVQNTRIDDKIAPNFYISELVKSELAIRRGINNWFRTDKQLQTAIRLAREVLQPIRDYAGGFTPNSVFRSQALERALKNKPQTWSSRSQHTKGEAADIEVPPFTTYELAEWISKYIEIDQLIMEMHDPKIPSSGWVHVSYNEHNRGEILSYIPDKSRFIYVPGLVSSA